MTGPVIEETRECDKIHRNFIKEKDKVNKNKVWEEYKKTAQCYHKPYQRAEKLIFSKLFPTIQK